MFTAGCTPAGGVGVRRLQRSSLLCAVSVQEYQSDAPYAIDSSLEKQLSDPDETFSQMLMRLIRESGKGAVAVYKNANVDRKLFSKIRTDSHYVPCKKTVLSFAVSLELSLEQTERLLKTAGYCFSASLESDIIFKYFITQARYDIYEIEAALAIFSKDN